MRLEKTLKHNVSDRVLAKQMQGVLPTKQAQAALQRRAASVAIDHEWMKKHGYERKAGSGQNQLVKTPYEMDRLKRMEVERKAHRLKEDFPSEPLWRTGF